MTLPRWLFVVLLALVALVPGCAESRGQVPAPPTSGREHRVLGERMRLAGTVTRVLGEHAFVVGTADEPVLVINVDDPAPDVGASVSVSGFVRAFDVDALEAALNVDLDEGRSVDAETCVVAESVRVEGRPR